MVATEPFWDSTIAGSKSTIVGSDSAIAGPGPKGTLKVCQNVLCYSGLAEIHVLKFPFNTAVLEGAKIVSFCAKVPE